MLEIITSAITDAGYLLGMDGIGIALDPAASPSIGRMAPAILVIGVKLSSDDMIERYAEMIDAFPIWSIEDGLGEDDNDGWQRLTSRPGEGRVGAVDGERVGLSAGTCCG